MADGRFVSGRLINFQPEGNKRGIQVILPASLDAKFTVVSKTLPDLETSWNGYRLAWINNIGLEQKISGATVEAGEYYEIQFAQPGAGNARERILVYWDGANIQAFNSDDFDVLTNGTVAARLKLVDPPTGWGTR
jgi:hypothetical protein